MAAQPGDRVLVASGLVKKFGSVHAVNGIDLALQQGECLALLGPNGAGKTTTVEMLEGLLTPDAGSVTIFGMSLADRRAAIMERTGVLLQETALYKRYTVRETLELFASFFAKSADPDQVIDRMQLREKEKVQLRKLSGGQKQRVYIGCALVNNPDLLFLDEPTTGLDPQARRAIWDLLSGLKSEGRSILLTTHYMEEAETLADRVAIVDHGRIIAEGTPRKLIEETCGKQILQVSFAEEGPEPATRLAGKLPWFASHTPVDGGYEVTAANAAASIRELIQATDALGITLKNLEFRRSTLEDVFLKLTGRSIRSGH